MSPADAATGGAVSGEVEKLTAKTRELQSALLSDLGGNRFECFRAPTTLTDAYTEAQAFQAALADDPDGKKKRRMMEEEAERTKKWAMPPGESLIDENHAPFLAYNEEYFRHITAEDVAALVPEGPTKLEDDPDFRIPALGRYYVLGESAASPQSRSPFRSLFPTGSVRIFPAPRSRSRASLTPSPPSLSRRMGRRRRSGSRTSSALRGRAAQEPSPAASAGAQAEEEEPQEKNDTAG